MVIEIVQQRHPAVAGLNHTAQVSCVSMQIRELLVFLHKPSLEQSPQ